MMLLPALLLLSSCKDNTTLIHEYQAIPPEGWSCLDTLFFHLPKNSTPDSCSIGIGARIERDYPYSILPIIVEQIDSLHSLIASDTVTLQVSDGKNPTGEGIHRKVTEGAMIPLKKETTIITLRHNYWKHRILGVTDVGINVRVESFLHQSSGK